MMTRWSTDACRRDPSIVSSNLTNPTFSLNTFFLSTRRFLFYIRGVFSLMGADAPIPPVAMNAAAPGGAPPRRIDYRVSHIVETHILQIR